jgi:hypothetical protein
MASNKRPSSLLQVAPPLLLLWPASTTHGPALYVTGGLFFLIGMVSLFRIAYLLLHPDKPYARLLRPSIAAGICALAALYTHASLVPAREFASVTATRLQAECNRQNVCPRSIAGWQPRGDRYSSRIDYGKRVHWPVLYHSDGERFEVRLYKALDVGESWSGGVDQTPQ